MSPPALTVVIPTYNGEQYITSAIQSVYAQSQPPTELIVVDDSSTDRTASILDKLIPAAPFPARVIRLPCNSGGPARPLNVGIRAASGSLIATLDHDDSMHPEKLHWKAKVLAEHNDIGLVFGRCRSRSHNGSDSPLVVRANQLLDEIPKLPIGDREYKIEKTIAYEMLHVGNQYAISCSNFLFPKSAWAAVGGFDESVRGCCDFRFLQEVTKNYDIGLIDEVLFHWDRRTDNLSWVGGVQVTDEWFRVYKRYDPSYVRPERREAFTQHMRSLILREQMDLAYRLRKRGRGLQALGTYLACAANPSHTVASVVGMAKVPVDWALVKWRQLTQ